MLEPSDRSRSCGAQRGQLLHTASEVGRIVVGGREFVVVPIHAKLDHIAYREHARFDLGNTTLGVFEPRQPDHPDVPDPADDALSRLSGRELQIAVLVALGYATKNIAYRLQISEWTVCTYLRRLFAKLDVDNRPAMVFRCAPLIQAALVSGLSRSELAARAAGPPSRSDLARHWRNDDGTDTPAT